MCVALFAHYQPAYASTTIYAEDFSAPLEQSWRVRWNQQWSDQSIPCMNGTVPATWVREQERLHLSLSGPPCVIDLVPERLDLKQLSSYNLSVRVWMPNSIWMNRSIAFLWQDPQNWYDLQIYGDRITLQKWIQGKPYTLPGSIADIPFQPNQSYLFTIEVTQQQRVRVLLGEQVILDVQDQAPFLPQVTTKSIALRGSLGASTYSMMEFDDVRITADIPPTQILSLNTPLFKQNDPRWGALEYDTATEWSPVPSMSRWGCALTSMVMVMHHHGITRFPDGGAITPLTLNQWLKNQPDGYFVGNLNWHAVTRLTRLVHAKYHTPKLEFTRADGTTTQVIDWAKKEITAKKPVILGVPGHFFVADGINYMTDTLLIKDPLFNYALLNQQKKDVITIRRFKPSFTDLSYLLFLVPEDADIEVRDEQGRSTPAERSSEYIQDQTDEQGAQSPRVHQVFVPKPSAGTYTVTVKQPEEKEYHLQVLTYDAEGGVKTQSQQGSAGPEGHSFQIIVEKTPSSPQKEQLSWQSFRLMLVQGFKEKRIKHKFVWTYLDSLSQRAGRASRKQQLLYIRVLQQSLKIYTPFIEKKTAKRLSNHLESLKEQADRE